MPFKNRQKCPFKTFYSYVITFHYYTLKSKSDTAKLQSLDRFTFCNKAEQNTADILHRKSQISAVFF